MIGIGDSLDCGLQIADSLDCGLQNLLIAECRMRIAD
ncbi:hypothetical protein D1AOALGA4SA_241 [Olavius algarvensis Delta 1 endosymbiont]|nr:hypothetical protein D1AOALGA4SA_241 [Olavius algarvensis Delta 1 endosymbiont]